MNTQTHDDVLDGTVQGEDDAIERTMSEEQGAPQTDDEVLDRSARRVDDTTERARVFEQEGDFRQAAELYDQAAEVWRQASNEMTEERQDFCLSLANYWAERANEAREQVAVAAKVETAPPQTQRLIPQSRDMAIQAPKGSPSGERLIIKGLAGTKEGRPTKRGRSTFRQIKD